VSWELFGAKPRPWVVLLGLDEAVVEELTPLFPTCIAVDSISEVRLEEWDLLITGSGAPNPTSIQGFPLITVGSIFILAFGGMEFGLPHKRVELNSTVSQIGTRSEVVASQFMVPQGLPSAVKKLVEQDLVPKALERTRHPVIAETAQGAFQRNLNLNEILPFLQTSQGEILAGSFERENPPAECWILPSYASPTLWARLAASQWEAVAPERFPPQADWKSSPTWRTPAEAEVLAAKQTLEEERERVLSELAAREVELDLQAEARRIEAERKERLLLTARGEELVGIVKLALEQVGFSARAMDEVFPKGDLREDLRITSPEGRNWEAIVEVRAYNGGASVTDLMRLQRFAQRYETDEQHPPNACWYIVNQLIGQDPATRPQVLTSQPDEVAYFIETYSGLLIDTAELFKLWLHVQSERLTADSLRTKLMAMRGVVREDTVGNGALGID
jgi:hypothetical protein